MSFGSVSIHAPVMGATASQVIQALVISFNPRTRDGCDVRLGSRAEVATVSIHAPVMGATYLVIKTY